MNCNVTLTADEFKQIHNTLWELQYQDLDSKIGAERIREALASAYEQERLAFENKSAHYEQVCDELGLNTVWSIYEVDNLNERFPFEGVSTVTYKDHWGEKPVVKPISGSTWAALWVAANACIRDSGDNHHVFIENFKQSGDTLILSTGS